MGIPHYFYTITKNYPGIIHLSKPDECNHFFLDFNGLVHHSVHEILKKYKDIEKEETIISQDTIEQDILDNCWEYLNHCIKIAKPNSMVHICIDGVAPIAKMNQQRKRRYLSVFQSKLKGENRIWDTNAVSPGTKFMLKLKS
jgi:5'-3' exoribonuclease 1